MVDYEKSFYKLEKTFDRMARYVEDSNGCCPVCFDSSFQMDRCLDCAMSVCDSRDKGYNKEESVKCWKEVFLMESEG